MNKLLLTLIILPLILNSSCQKEDLTEETDITQFSWKVKSVKSGISKVKVKEEDFNKGAYILVFLNDSTFQLNTSVNVGMGTFEMTFQGEMNILGYGTLTQVGGHNKIDEKLLEVTPLIMSYQVLGDVLIFKGEKSEIEFEKE